MKVRVELDTRVCCAPSSLLVCIHVTNLSNRSLILSGKALLSFTLSRLWVLVRANHNMPGRLRKSPLKPLGQPNAQG